MKDKNILFSFDLLKTANEDLILALPISEQQYKLYVFDSKFFPVTKFSCAKATYNSHILKYVQPIDLDKLYKFKLMEMIINHEFEGRNSPYTLGYVQFCNL